MRGAQAGALGNKIADELGAYPAETAPPPAGEPSLSIFATEDFLRDVWKNRWRDEEWSKLKEHLDRLERIILAEPSLKVSYGTIKFLFGSPVPGLGEIKMGSRYRYRLFFRHLRRENRIVLLRYLDMRYHMEKGVSSGSRAYAHLEKWADDRRLERNLSRQIIFEAPASPQE